MSEAPRSWSGRRAAVSASAAALTAGAGQEALRGLGQGEAWSWASMTAHAVPLVFVWFGIGWLVNRMSVQGWHPPGSARQLREERSRIVAPVLAAGRLPEGTDPQLWRRPLQDEARELAVTCLVWRGLSALVVCLVAAAAVMADDGAWTVWAVAAVVAVRGVLLPRRSARRLRAVRRLLGDLPPARTVP